MATPRAADAVASLRSRRAPVVHALAPVSLPDLGRFVADPGAPAPARPFPSRDASGRSRDATDLDRRVRAKQASLDRLGAFDASTNERRARLACAAEDRRRERRDARRRGAEARRGDRDRDPRRGDFAFSSLRASPRSRDVSDRSPTRTTTDPAGLHDPSEPRPERDPNASEQPDAFRRLLAERRASRAAAAAAVGTSASSRRRALAASRDSAAAEAASRETATREAIAAAIARYRKLAPPPPERSPSGSRSPPKSKSKSTPKAPDPTPPPSPPARPTAGSPPPREPRAASASASVTSASASVDSVRASPASSRDPLAGATRPREDPSGSTAGSVDDDRRVDDGGPLEPSRALSRSARGLSGPDEALAPRLIDSDPRGSLGRAARRVAFPTLPRVVAGSAGARPSALAARLERAWDVLDVSLARRLDWSVALTDADADADALAGADALADAVAAWEFAAAAVDARADAASRLERRIAEANATRAASASASASGSGSGSGGDGVLDCGAGKVSAEEARAFRDAEDAAANVYRAAALLAAAVGGGRAETFESTLEFLLRFPLHA